MKRLLSLLTVALFVAVLVALGGCGSGATTPVSTTSKEGQAKQINFFQWTEYTPQSVLDSFKAKYGITVKMSNFSSNEEMMAKLQAGGLSEYDVVVPSNYVVKAMIALNLIEPLNKDSIPNLKNIYGAFLNRSYDPGNKYCVPYMSSPVVLAVNTKKVKEPINSYNDLLNPALRNQIVVVDDERPIIGAALLATGHSLNSTKASALKDAENWLKRLRPNIKVFDSDSPKTELINGECSVGLIYNGEAALAIRQNPDIKIVWPKEGIAGLTIDNLCVVKGTKHEKEANLFINYLLDPEASKAISDVYPYTNPNKAAHSLLSKTYLDNPASNIPLDKIKNSELIGDLGSALRQYDRIWTEFKG
ncbi:Bacterial periplasmic spermidine/putrescine-binding protein [Acididesulfobacillus acetoxydans]|uniref:Bacterial periplasmic spermidine/putrescine-binding protein n=1 Tax=Acididesulfobacillus acetoxydans TaxID=1561005 RepID=A0A8S0Y4X4_9FIRM|nr:spermidine/putrescine ABC transporter substrate-binding protein [Acididesulfobacillus acetoxydans]CAA7603395.1 Bacterial periplasmic spermidine/putrescine-binding protein [Acididesulfobacillus acetoxydans]CEJ08306.1 Spermidine/putrescine-binding periplasmic protein 2 [Acididesulfobacillus acetoxydans]